jgi:aspartyl/asparaginyl-tRNA synthetase
MAEFWMIEPELAFADVFDTMECAEAYIQFCIRYILENNKEDLEFFDKKKPGQIDYLKKLVNGPFARASYSQAIEILLKVIFILFSVFKKELYLRMKCTGVLIWHLNMKDIFAITSSISQSYFTTILKISKPST